MKNIIKNIKYIIIILILFSCEKDFIINVPNTEPKQVIIGEIRENRKIKIYLSKSKKFDDNSSVEFIPDATIQLFENNEFKENLTFQIENANNGLGYYISTLNATPNNTYKIISNANGLKTVDATEILHPKITIANHELLQYPDTENIYKKGIIQFTLNDVPNIKNYYIINVYEKIKTFEIINVNDTIYKDNWLQSNFSMADYPRINEKQRLFINDSKFANSSKTFNIQFDGNVITQNNLVEQIVFLEVISVGEGYYNYYLSDQQNKSGVSNINKEPISLISNINNGFGHFSSYNSKSYSYRIQ